MQNLLHSYATFTRGAHWISLDEKVRDLPYHFGSLLETIKAYFPTFPSIPTDIIQSKVASFNYIAVSSTFNLNWPCAQAIISSKLLFCVTTKLTEFKSASSALIWSECVLNELLTKRLTCGGLIRSTQMNRRRNFSKNTAFEIENDTHTNGNFAFSPARITAVENSSHCSFAD